MEIKTLKRTVKETHTVEKEINVTLPYYSKSKTGTYLYAVIADKKYIEVQTYGCMAGIRIMEDICFESPFADECTEITEQEFKDGFYGQVNGLIGIVESKPEEDEEAV